MLGGLAAGFVPRLGSTSQRRAGVRERAARHRSASVEQLGGVPWGVGALGLDNCVFAM